jgi:hypothetical protein
MVSHRSYRRNWKIRTNQGVDAVELTGEAVGLLLVLIRWWTRKCLDGFDGLD